MSVSNFKGILGVIFCFFCIGVFGNVNVSTYKFSPSYFIPNKVGTKRILKNSETVAFVQTFRGMVQFTSKGAYIGIVVSPAAFETEDKKNFKHRHLPDGVFGKGINDKKLVVMGIGFGDKKTGGRKSVNPTLEEKTKATVNFYVGKRDNWQTNIPTYRKLKYPGVWKGIDIEYIGYMDKLEYRVIVKPQGDVSSIVMSTGAENLIITEKGDLQTTLDGATLTMTKPYAYQIVNGRKVKVPVKYKLLSNGNYTFDVSEYDRSRELIIDPYLEWSTFIDGVGNGAEYGMDIAIDNDGNAYVTGIVLLSDFPVTNNAYDTTLGGNQDVFVLKLSPDGSSLVYSTYLGGSDYESGNAIAVDNSGNVYIAGETRSGDFPITDNAYDKTPNGMYDVFVAKLSSDGSTLLYSTFLGGGLQEYANDIVIDNLGNAYIVGTTQSSDFPVTNGAYDITFNGNSDVFVAKLSADGTSLVYSTFIGANGDDYGTGIDIDSSGNAYLTGTTYCFNFPVNDEAYDISFNGDTDAFVIKLNSTGSSIVYSTFLGGSGSDSGISIVVDSSNYAYVVGQTVSSNFPTTGGAYNAHLNGNFDVFITKLNPTGSSLVYSTYLGGSGAENVSDIALDSSNNSVCVVGETSSTDYPTTSSAFDRSFNGHTDIFVTRLSPNGSYLVFSTFLNGDDGYGAANGVKIDDSGNVYVAGSTAATNFPVTDGAYDRIFNGGFSDVFVTKLNSNGTSLLFSTYIGGVSSNLGRSIKLDSDGNIYITGETTSSNFPVTEGVYDISFNGNTDIFVSKLNANASSLLASTFLGGSDNDNGYDLVIDGSNNLWVAGFTESDDFPVTNDAVDKSYKGEWDGFVARLTCDNLLLIYSTYLGGSEDDMVKAITIDSRNNIYLVGSTGSSDFPVSNGAYSTTHAGYNDVFVTKLSSDGSSMIYSTFVGGGSDDWGDDITVDDSGNVFVAGHTWSGDFPTTNGSFNQRNSGKIDAFVFKLNETGSSLVYSTYIGGSNYDFGFGIVVDGDGDAFVTGYTRSRDFPVTDGVLGQDCNGYADVFVAKLSFDGSSLIYSTYFGGNSDDLAFDIVRDNSGNLYITGFTRSDNFAVTPDAFDSTFNGLYDVFVSKLNSDLSSVIYSTYLGGSSRDYGQKLALDDFGGLYLVGWTYSSDFFTTDGIYDNAFNGEVSVFVSKFNLGTNLPLPVVNAQTKELISTKGISSGIVNPFNTGVSLNFLYYDQNNTLIDSKTESMPAFGKMILKSSDNLEYSQMKVVSDCPLIVYSDVETDNGKMSAYVSLDLSNELYIPHIAESTDWWDTNVFLMNDIPGDLNVLVMNNSYLLTTAGFFTTIDMENYITEDPDSLKCWGKIVSDSGSENSSGRLFTGFETFVHNGTDGAAVELQTTGHTTLFIPHIPEETDIFWTGFAFINPGENDASLTVNFYTSDGEMLGSQTITIPARSKVSDLMKNLFPDYFGKAEWGIITSDLPIIGIEIYGTQKDGICGYSLPYLAQNMGILPEVISGDGLWSGIALTNVGDSVANITIQLMDKDGNVKAERQETISPRCRFKAVVSDYFDGVDLEDGDYVKYDSDGSIIAVVVNGDLDRTFMTALTNTN